MKLKILAKKLSSLQLHKEASDVIKLKPLEHPDWKDEWEELCVAHDKIVVPSFVGRNIF